MLKMFVLLFLGIIIRCGTCLDMNLVTNAVNSLKFKPPITIISSLEDKVKLVKYFFQINQYMVFQDLNLEQSVCEANLHVPNHKLIKEGPSTLVILNQSMFEFALNNMKCEINQEVLLLNENTKELFETYTINNVKIKKKLGYFDSDNGFNWIEEQDMVKRRSNFQGIHLKSLTIPSGDWIKLKPSHLAEATYFANNQTYDVTQHVGGILIDMFEILKSQLNFTAKYYMRKDRQYGNVVKYSNGTFGGIGSVPDLYNGKVDVLTATIVMTNMRIPYLDFLPPSNSTFGKMIIIK